MLDAIPTRRPEFSCHERSTVTPQCHPWSYSYNPAVRNHDRRCPIYPYSGEQSTRAAVCTANSSPLVVGLECCKVRTHLMYKPSTPGNLQFYCAIFIMLIRGRNRMGNFLAVASFSRYLGWGLAQGNSTVVVSGIPPVNASAPIPEAFVSYSIEFAFFPDFAGTFSHHRGFHRSQSQETPHHQTPSPTTSSTTWETCKEPNHTSE